MADPTVKQQAICVEVAQKYHISPCALWDMYYDITQRNLADDLDDIARENLEELERLTK